MKATLGKNIKALRTKKGISQKKLCNQVDITIRHLLRIEKGEVDPSFILISKIAKILGTTTDTLAR